MGLGMHGSKSIITLKFKRDDIKKMPLKFIDTSKGSPEDAVIFWKAITDFLL